VTAFVDAAEDLWLIGDGSGNSVLVGPTDKPDEFSISGYGTSTTVNGQHQIVLFSPGRRFVLVFDGGNNTAGLGADFSSNPACCRREVVFVGGAGDDSVFIFGPGFEVMADLGAGDDRFTVPIRSLGLENSSVSMGEGDDVLTVGESTNLTDCVVKMGAGADRLELEGASLKGTRIEMGPAAGSASLDDDIVSGSASGSFELEMGFGDDVVSLENLNDGAALVDAGPGADWLRITGDPRFHGTHRGGPPVDRDGLAGTTTWSWATWLPPRSSSTAARAGIPTAILAATLSLPWS
jgi:hypothetical protein